MSKIAQAFARGKAFIPFITCGDPNLETTAAAVRAAVENGADLIELGIPFSDPLNILCFLRIKLDCCTKKVLGTAHQD